jgi:MFS family permease
MGFALDGLFVFGLSLFAVAGLGRSGVIAASVAMALRYVSEIVLSPSGGKLAHKYGARRMLVALSLGAASTLAMLGGSEPLLWLGVLSTVILRALRQPLAAPVIAGECAGPGRVLALARQAVWRDIGAAAGPLAGGFLFPMLPLLIYASLCRGKPWPGKACASTRLRSRSARKSSQQLSAIESDAPSV